MLHFYGTLVLKPESRMLIIPLCIPDEAFNNLTRFRHLTSWDPTCAMDTCTYDSSGRLHPLNVGVNMCVCV